jgi:hypothetical protein
VNETADVPFEKAMAMADADLHKQQYKILFSVPLYRGQGYASPELPDVDVATGSGILLGSLGLVFSKRPPPLPPALATPGQE